ncbi:adenylate kinase [Mycobacterium sp. 852002-30065_SCH5024008]|uniref:adenylate kinase n=1 Tax=Mycobacterium sp. 852002-30065_SCH5024008 TaxID=1834088 RepID=UPI000A563AAE|nr:adenylate kinase [Mycobacterium sp. 852002-30065_SCH5024008]
MAPKMNRVVILGRGGAGKSTLAQQLSAKLGAPAIELDRIFWKPGSQPTAQMEWSAIQHRLISSERWILDGDLGPYDNNLALRISAADTIIVLDFPFWRCTLRTLRRSRENGEYWRWIYHYRRTSLPAVLDVIAKHADHAAVHILHNPPEVRRFLETARDQ